MSNRLSYIESTKTMRSITYLSMGGIQSIASKIIMKTFGGVKLHPANVFYESAG